MYRLPNGDVLVAETNSPPREGGGHHRRVMGYLMKKAGAAGAVRQPHHLAARCQWRRRGGEPLAAADRA